jgi:DsbC/DsbD-like thiol-disulfide interchange protein
MFHDGSDTSPIGRSHQENFATPVFSGMLHIMKSCLSALAFTAIATSAQPPGSAGHARAEWISESPGAAEPGIIRTVIKLTLDDGWHTYWINPGEGGMPLSVTWDLPDDWSAGEVQYPAPKRFMTGDLPGFGYEGAVLLPVRLTYPPELREAVTLSGEVSWLTCNDSSCVPGSARVSLRIDPGTDGENARKQLVEKAFSALPRSAPGARLEAALEDDVIVMTLALPEDSEIDPGKLAFFPATRNIIDPAAEPVFEKVPTAPNTWRATAPKSEYLDGTPDVLTAVLADGETSWILSGEK